ncbi:hypothetical protein N7532_004762 [Penicillium argentinense]|uniref:Major facilitator superfamily (MFS) profile domain-containing protein n=1 Tax=Penicillium argentinense TaxID=1131581 RepID=A0A9W9KFY7_9EURO|nr:uncharacterized protein N7532_004762 [Penicillium argentinense]KAJ5104233.1 hypothetical protein N7532_004762 [Penicillium argentinense]
MEVDKDLQTGSSAAVRPEPVSLPESMPQAARGAQTTSHRSRILRKLDMHILPLMFITYGLQFLDKALLGYAAVFTFRIDTHLLGQEYSWVGSIFYFGYMIFEYPLAGLLHSFAISMYLGFLIFTWGVTVVMSNFCVSFAGLMISRFVLGTLEGAVAPCFLVIIGGSVFEMNFFHADCSTLAHWYTLEEQPLRQVLWFLGTPVFGIFGGLVSYALGHTHTAVASWRLLYIIFGSVTAIWGVFFACAFPSSPGQARFLTEHERTDATLRVLSFPPNTCT